MSAALKIELTVTPDSNLVHRFHNFGEDIYSQLHDIYSMDIEEIDRPTCSFVVRDIHKRDLGRVSQVVKRELKRHHLEDAVRLVRQ